MLAHPDYTLTFETDGTEVTTLGFEPDKEAEAVRGMIRTTPWRLVKQANKEHPNGRALVLATNPLMAITIARTILDCDWKRERALTLRAPREQEGAPECRRARSGCSRATTGPTAW